MNENYYIYLGGMATVVGGLSAWLFRHITNGKKHPDADAIVYRDVCEQVQKRIENTVNLEIAAMRQQIQNLDEKLEDRFAELKRLIISNGNRP